MNQGEEIRLTITKTIRETSEREQLINFDELLADLEGQGFLNQEDPDSISAFSRHPRAGG